MKCWIWQPSPSPPRRHRGKGAIVVGYKLAGIPAQSQPASPRSFRPFYHFLISVFYTAFRENFIVSQMLSGMQAGVGAVIASVVWDRASGITEEKSTHPCLSWQEPSLPPVSLTSTWCMWSLSADSSALPYLPREEKGAEMIYLQLFSAFCRSDLQFRWRVRHAFDSGTGGEYSRLAGNVGIYRSDYHLPDDSRPHRHQLSYLRGHQDRRYPRCLVATAGCILPSCIIVTLIAKLYLEIPGYGSTSGSADIPAPGSGRHDRLRRHLCADYRFRGEDTVIDPLQTNWILVVIFLLCVLLLRRKQR